MEFKKISNFPNCIAAIERKHIGTVKPTENLSLYLNYKYYFSIILLAVCDVNYHFTYIDVGGYEKRSDLAIFKNSVLQNMEKIYEILSIFLKENCSWACLPNVLVSDEGL
jgi:hypothetical protein